MPEATRAEQAKMVEQSTLSLVVVVGWPRFRLRAGGCGAKVEPQCSILATLGVRISYDVGKQRQWDKWVLMSANCYHISQNRTYVSFDAKLRGPTNNGYVPQFLIKYQLNYSTLLRCDGHLKLHDTFITTQ
jgi:hypothetical protein